MGYIKHEALIAVTWNEERGKAIETFRDAMPSEFRGLLVGPVEAVMNGYVGGDDDQKVHITRDQGWEGIV